MDEQYFIELLQTLNPKNECGKIVVIVRCGVGSIRNTMKNLIDWKKQYKLNFQWVCDPMHGNTKKINGVKVRIIEDI